MVSADPAGLALREHQSIEQGRIPFTVRIGVTGHRSLNDKESLRLQIGKALARVRELYPPTTATPISLTVVSSLAEGADRFVARAVIEDNGLLEVCLPLEHDDYADDFPTPASKHEFEELLGRASLVLQAPRAGSREEAYELAGRHVVDHCDLLIAVWDKQPSRGRGGTAETIRYALEARIPVLLISASGDHSIHEDLGTGSLEEPFRATAATRGRSAPRGAESVPFESTKEAFARLDSFNGVHLHLSPTEFAHRVAKEADYLPSGASEIRGLPLDALKRWILPPFVNADAVASTFQKRYYYLTRWEFLLAALAVATVAIQEVFFPSRRGLAWIEFGFLFVLVTIVYVGRRRGLHGLWISSRYLAERLRSAFFLAAIGLGNRGEGGFSATLGRPEEWVTRAFAYVWNHRPRVESGEAPVSDLKDLLITGWVDGQIRYHEKRSRWHKKQHQVLAATTVVFFGITAVAALLHAIHVWDGSREEILVVLAITLPAFGASIAGIAAHRQHERHAHTYAGMAESLQAVREKMERAFDLATLQAEAAEAEDIMAGENQDWLGVMRFHNFELHV